MITISLVCCGNYHRINYFLGQELEKNGVKVNYLSMNFKSYEFFNSKGIKSFYLYKNFNDFFKKTKNDEINKLDWNIYRALKADKQHWNKKNAKYQEKSALTFLKIFKKWNSNIFENVLFPIIESMDVYLLYEFCKRSHKKPFIYCHGRNIDVSFFSDSYKETFPEYSKNVKVSIKHKKNANKILSQLRLSKNNLNYKKQADKFLISETDIFHEDKILEFWIIRLIKNFYYNSTFERHNQLFSYVTKFLVSIERVLVPTQKICYFIFEKLFIKPLKTIDYPYDFFALHFSPESSINTPNPEFINQIRVIDKILLERDKSSRLLLVKEHPAMYFKRPISFYAKLKKNPLVRFVSANSDTKYWYKNANTVYSVTGTVLLEAYVDNKNWKKIGNNFLDGVKENDTSVEDFIAKLLSVSGNFIYVSPPSKKNSIYMRLFSKKNIYKMSQNLLLHIKMSNK